MFAVSSPVLAVCFMAIASTVSSQPTHVIAEQTNEASSINIVDDTPSSYEYQFVPSSQYAVAAYHPESSLLDYILSPITAVASIASSALSVTHMIFVKSGLVFLGMAIVIGFCALTPYCTLTIEKPIARQGKSTFPYLEDLEYYFREAYNKFHEA